MHLLNTMIQEVEIQKRKKVKKFLLKQKENIFQRPIAILKFRILN